MVNMPGTYVSLISGFIDLFGWEMLLTAAGIDPKRFGDLANRELAEFAFFDSFPASNNSGFVGAWSVYPYLPSGTIILSDVANGLFVLSMQ